MSTSSAGNPKPFLPVKSDVNLPQQEDEILTFWDERKIFDKSIHARKDAKPYSFYDGPPFATGLPHYGHIMAGVLKDIVPRYWTMNGYSVPRRFGWDCHGLPVEFEINKKLNLHSRKDVLAYGVDRYNAECRSIVQRYSTDWKKTVRRVGRWVDMENSYFTMDVSFMQSVWWVFKRLFEQGLIYEGYKVVPYSVGLSTPLSNFEANLNYKTVQDPAVTVNFPVIGQPGVELLAWTTTPWTLPSNLGLMVGKDLDYVQVRETASSKQYLLAEALVPSVFRDQLKGLKKSEDWIKGENGIELVRRLKGAEMLGWEYEPIFSYFAEYRKKGAFKIIWADHVTTESGTGIVHCAPAFGEDDYYASKREGMPVANPVDDDGMFTAEVPEYQGRRVKEADKDIIAAIKTQGRLFKQDTLEHSYPFCWRTDTPLIYRAVSSWFVAVEKIKDQLVANNKTTQWVPEHLRDGRFGNWLENARDWAISRNRFWGTPLPIWRNAEGEIICVGSRDELEKLTGQKVNDLHMETIDPLTIPSPTGKSPLKRIDPVLDCWFESGAMPMAQFGYPFENKAEFEASFPADFIAEGLDQTRGWFYTLMVLGTAIFGKAPFKNVVVNGLILAEDGKKMSKSLKNYPDPMEVLYKHGADALRLYLIDSPVVKAQELKFAEAGVRDVVRRILLRWWNSYAFFINYANIDDFRPRGDFAKSENILDRWILSRLHTLIETTHVEMSAYRLYNVVPQLLLFIDDLTNTYIRFNRSHFWQDGMPEDKRLAYETLYEVLSTFSRVMAPFAPFMAEATFQNLVRVLPTGLDDAGSKNASKAGPIAAAESVHLQDFPQFVPAFKRPELEEAVRAMEALVTLSRNFREKIQVRAKIPLRSMKIIHRDAKVLDNLRLFQAYFQGELNIQRIDYVTDEDTYIQISARANFPVLGKRVGAKMKTVAAGIQRLGLPELLRLERGEAVTVEGEAITLSDLQIVRASRSEYPNAQTHALVSIDVDPTVTEEQTREGLAREVVRKVQAARKSADFLLDDRIALELRCDGALKAAVEAHQAMLMHDTLTVKFAFSTQPQGQHVETADIDGESVEIGITPMPRT